VIGRRSRRQHRCGEVAHRLRPQLLDPLLREKHRGGFTASGLDAAGRVLKAGDDRKQADREHGRGHERFRKREAARPVPYCTLTRPEAATTTLRLPPFGFVTVNVPASVAAPSCEKTTGPPETVMLFEIVTRPLLSVPVPVQIAHALQAAFEFCR
jgi:hypothetical protein